MLDGTELLLVCMAAVGAGIVNALAGGGSLITFPALMAVGVPPVAANVTNTVALCPGYLGATLAQAKDLVGQKGRMRLLLPAGIVGGILGGFLLLNTTEKVFTTLVPFLILLASALLAVQERLRAWLIRRGGHSDGRAISETWAVLPIGIAAVYGGYFGAGLSVIVLAVLGLLINDNLTRLNAIKQSISFSINVAAALFFLFSGKTVWSAAIVMAAGALIGGTIGGRLASRIKPSVLRVVVVVTGTVVGLIYLRRLW